jgi:hypothetical protein
MYVHCELGFQFVTPASLVSSVLNSFTEVQAQKRTVLMILMSPQQKLLLSPNKQKDLPNNLQFRRSKKRAVVKRILVVRMKLLKVIDFMRFVF